MTINFALFENLVCVDLSHNNLACGKPFFIPKCILKIPQLQTIDMSYNNIVEFPPCAMWVSSHLHELNFSHNRIHRLDLLNAKTSFQHLNILDLSYNLIRRIPSEIGYLSKLTLLNISYNPNLKSLPDEIGLLRNKNLNSLIREGLTLNIPKHINQNTQLREILKYYYDRLKQSVEYNVLRLMVLGFSGRGKTSLLNSLQGKKQKPNKSHNSTDIEVSTWKLQSRQPDRAVEYKLVCWDMVGQEDFFCSHECFLSQRALYLLVFDLTKDIEEVFILKPWLWNIKSQAPHAPLIVVGTHLDKLKESDRLNQCSFIKNKITKLCISPGFPKISDIVFVDSRTSNQSISILKNKILTVLNNHRIQNEQTLVEKQPSSYLKLEELFQETLKILPPTYPILTEKEVKDLIIKHKLDLNDEELKLAIQFLHDCGVIVHFNDTLENINNLYFLKPQWICAVIAKTITMKSLNPFIHNGIIKSSDFLELFKKSFNDQLPGNITIEIQAKQCMKVLEKYDVIFQNSEKEIIIPSRLPINPPDNVSENTNSSKISRIFEFSFLPTGFWPRLIARISVLAKSFDHLFNVYKLELIMWRTGVIISLEKSIYLVLEGKHHTDKNKEIIDISVTKSELGIKILVQIVDCIEVLIDEWYPGLTDDDLYGNRVMISYALCPDCNSVIPLLDIARKSMESDHITCVLEHNLPIRIVAPDIVLGDLPNDLIINPHDLEVNKSKSNLIGTGGNGSVYKGYYKGQDCAVKYINNINHSNDPPSYRLLRQEIDILRRFQHPSLVNMLAVDREKIVLEFAPLKDLKFILSNYKNLSRRLLQRMSFQVISGIKYLHFNNIIYRDIKMQNVLVFSLELSSPVNVKIGDYGISREVAPFGFVIPQGTHGYQAPEVLERTASYKLPADIFSFGILLYNIATRGHHPADFKTHWRAGKQIELISEYRNDNWPRIQDCINKCTKLVPEDRPNAEDISNFICCSTFVAIKSVWPLTRQTRIECMVTMVNENHTLDVFLANGNQFKQEVRCIDIMTGQSKGKSFVNEKKTNRILCMIVFNNTIFLGTQNGKVWIYNYSKNTFISSSITFNDSILSMIIVELVDDSKIFMMGLANGVIHYKLHFTSISDLKSSDFNEINLSNAPVINLHFSNDRIFATSGSIIYKMIFSHKNDELELTKVLELDSNNQDRLIKCFCPLTENINGSLITSFYFTIRNECLIYNHDDQGNQQKPAIDCKELIREKFGLTTKSNSSRIMCLTVWSGDRYLCAGTGNGYLIIIDQIINYTVVLSMFQNPIICIQHKNLSNNYFKSDKEINKSISVAKPEVMDQLLINDDSFKISNQNMGLLIVGNGYKSIGEDDFKGAVLIVLSDDVSNIARQLDEHINSRNNIL